MRGKHQIACLRSQGLPRIKPSAPEHPFGVKREEEEAEEKEEEEEEKERKGGKEGVLSHRCDAGGEAYGTQEKRLHPS